MKILSTPLDGVKIIEPVIFKDPRGAFMETYNEKKYKNNNIVSNFVQDNISFSTRNTLRGLHYQYPHAQAKLVQVISGEIFDVAMDIRRNSKTFGQWTSVVLSEENNRQLFIPEGFAHGFCVLSETAVFMYKCGDFYSPECEGGIIWSDPNLGIKWPIDNPLLSEKDNEYSCLKDIPFDRLPQ